MIDKITNSVVFPIVPAYNKDQDVKYDSIHNYVDYLKNDGASIFMTTAGTSQFHLLTNREIFKINSLVREKCDGTFIAGLKPGSLRETKEWIKEHNSILKGTDSCLLLLYPERYYDDDSIVKYFSELADYSKVPVLIHGMFMRRGNGGTYDFTADLVNELSEHPNIIGMKEENRDLMSAYNLCKDADTDNFGIIVAGGSQKRFSLLQSVGAQSFLSGVGSLFPTIDITYHLSLNNNFYKEASELKTKYEDKLFDVFMGIGWHLSLRTALKQLKIISEYDRMPFVQPTKEQKKQIRRIVKDLME